MTTTIKQKKWHTSEREIDYSDKTLVMAILNVTPDSFSDGGRFNTLDKALRQAERFINEGADILDIGGESTRPNSERVPVEVEVKRVVPVIEGIKRRFDIPISIDTSKSIVAEKAISAGAEIINDISGLKFDKRIGKISAKHRTGLILMHLRGEFDTMHNQKPVDNILTEVSNGFNRSIETAKSLGVQENQICLDIGIGFSKTFAQNLELIAKLDKLCLEFEKYPILIGTSRKSFIGKILEIEAPDQRINGTIATNVISVWNGANIIRVHDIKALVEANKVVEAIKKEL